MAKTVTTPDLVIAPGSDVSNAISAAALNTGRALTITNTSDVELRVQVTADGHTYVDWYEADVPIRVLPGSGSSVSGIAAKGIRLRAVDEEGESLQVQSEVRCAACVYDPWAA